MAEPHSYSFANPRKIRGWVSIVLDDGASKQNWSAGQTFSRRWIRWRGFFDGRGSIEPSGSWHCFGRRCLVKLSSIWSRRNRHLHSRSSPSVLGACTTLVRRQDLQSSFWWICVTENSAYIPQRRVLPVFMLYYLVKDREVYSKQSWQISRKQQLMPSLHISFKLMSVTVISILVSQHGEELRDWLWQQSIRKVLPLPCTSGGCLPRCTNTWSWLLQMVSYCSFVISKTQM